MEDLSLTVIKNQVGILETNIETIEKAVAERLENYKPELYKGDVDEAKKDRAFLNASKKALTAERIRIIKELMKPYEDFEARCKAVEKSIDGAAALLDEIVKVKEEIEKQEKKAVVESRWKIKNFELVGLEKIFNQKWLNKTYKIKDIDEELDAFIKKVYSELKVIEAFGEDVDLLKAMYLENLDIGKTLDEGNRLKDNRAKIEKEKEERKAREEQAQKEENYKELVQEEKQAEAEKPVQDLVAEVMGEKVDSDPEITFTLKFYGKRTALLKLREFMLENGITYKKLEEQTCKQQI